MSMISKTKTTLAAVLVSGFAFTAQPMVSLPMTAALSLGGLLLETGKASAGNKAVAHVPKKIFQGSTKRLNATAKPPQKKDWGKQINRPQ